MLDGVVEEDLKQVLVIRRWYMDTRYVVWLIYKYVSVLDVVTGKLYIMSQVLGWSISVHVELEGIVYSSMMIRTTQ